MNEYEVYIKNLKDNEIIIPEEVYKELTSDADYIDEKRIIDNAEFIKVKNVEIEVGITEVDGLTRSTKNWRFEDDS